MKNKLWPNLRKGAEIFLEETNEQPLSVQTSLSLRFEPGTTGMQSSSAKRSSILNMLFSAIIYEATKDIVLGIQRRVVSCIVTSYSENYCPCLK
jgi:hypothetical protein